MNPVRTALAAALLTSAALTSTSVAIAGGYWHAPPVGQSAYAPPAYGQAFAPQSYPAPAYGVSAYGQPAYGHSIYGPTSYGQPAYGQTPYGPAGGRGTCGDGRPCGPAVINLVAPQGFFGADFRPACAAHDACYGASGASRAECDARFRAAMHAACADSRFPGGCHACAESRYFAVKTFGGPFFVGSQYGFPGGW